MAGPTAPLVIALALLAAGTAANIKAQRKVAKAQLRAFERFSRRSDKRTDEASAIFSKSAEQQRVDNQMDVANKAAAAKVGRVEDLIATQGFVDPMLPGRSRAPAVIKSQASASLADELARARAQIGALAQLEGFSTRSFERGLELDRVKPELGNLQLFAQGDRNIYEADQVAASHKGDKLALAGDLMTAIGSIMMGGSGAALGTASKLGTSAMDSPSVGSTASRSGYYSRLM
jgi:hypothetical protein